MEKTRTLTTNSAETTLFDEGSGPPIVMLHGMAATSDMWCYSFDALKGQHRVIAPDLPGHGRSQGANLPYSLAFYTSWLDDLINELSIDRVTLFGNSMGGAVCTAYALSNPARVERLVLADALGLGPDLPAAGIRHVLRNLHNFIGLLATRKSDPYLYRYLSGLVFVNPYGPARPVIETMLNLNMTQGPFGFWSAWAGVRLLIEDFLSMEKRRAFNQKLQALDMPTLITWGLHDGLLPVRNAYAGKENIPGAHLHILRQSAHSPMLEEPEEFNEVVGDFLQET